MRGQVEGQMSEASAPATELGLPMLFGPRPRPKRDIRIFLAAIPCAGVFFLLLERLRLICGDQDMVPATSTTARVQDTDLTLMTRNAIIRKRAWQRQRQKRADYVRRKRSMLPCIHRDRLRGLTLRSPLLQCAALCLEPIHFTESLAPWEDPISDSCLNVILKYPKFRITCNACNGFKIRPHPTNKSCSAPSRGLVHRVCTSLYHM